MKRKKSAKIAITFAVPPILLGFLVLIGWYTHNVTFIQVSPAFVPMQFNTALSFLIAGSGLICVIYSKSTPSRILGVLTTCFGGLTLIEYGLNIDINIDQLFMDHYIATDTSHPGRMGLNTAICFFLSGIAVLIGQQKNKSKRALFTICMLGTLILAIAVLALTGYGAELETAYGWGSLAGMAIHTALGFICVGVTLLAFCWSQENNENQAHPLWFAWVAGIGVSTVSVSLWFALISGTTPYAPIFVLIFGTILAIVLGISLHLYGQAHQHSAALESLNSLLAEEMLNSTAVNNQLRVTKARMERTFESLSDAVLTGDLTNRSITDCNQSTTEIFGYDKDELIGQSFSKLHVDNAAFQDLGEMLYPAITTSGIADFNYTMRKKDGTRFPSEITVTSNKDTFGELTEFVVVIRDVTARAQSDEDLRVALVDAEMANQAKSEFLATMSHELRTPLNAILGFSDILHNQYFGPPGAGKYREYAKDIHSSGEHLLELINDVLDISSIEAGKMVLNIIELEAHITIKECLDIVAEKGREKSITLSTDIPENLPLLHADKRAIRQIFLNLLSNALKFTPTGGKVEVSVIETDNILTFKVSDTGMGIAAEMIPNLMSPFTRVEQDPYKAVEGWGLGLSITKSLVNLHDGEIDIASSVNEGTTVTFTLPNIAA